MEILILINPKYLIKKERSNVFTLAISANCSRNGRQTGVNAIKHISYLLLIFFITIASLTACSKPDGYDHQGRAIFLKDYSNKWIMLNYWATWCKPCYAEIPDLNALYQKHRDKLIIFGISYDALSAIELQQFAQQQQVDYPLVNTNLGAHFGISQISVVPTTVLISPQGKIIQTWLGPQSAATFMASLESQA